MQCSMKDESVAFTLFCTPTWPGCVHTLLFAAIFNLPQCYESIYLNISKLNRYLTYLEADKEILLLVILDPPNRILASSRVCRCSTWTSPPKVGGVVSYVLPKVRDCETDESSVIGKRTAEAEVPAVPPICLVEVPTVLRTTDTSRRVAANWTQMKLCRLCDAVKLKPL